MKKITYAFLLTCVAAACAHLDEKAEKIVITNSMQIVEKCKLIGEIRIKSEDCFVDELTKLRNLAAEKSATHIYRAVGGISCRADAYICQ